MHIVRGHCQYTYSCCLPQYLLCRQSTGDAIVGMATGTSKVNNVEDPHRDRHAHSEGTRPPQGVLPPLPSPSSSLYKRPTSVWTEEYVWTLLTGDTQTCGQDGSTRVSARVAPSAEQSFEQLCQSRPTASCSASVTVEHTTTTTTSSKPHIARSVLCTTESAVSCPPSQRSPVLVPDAGVQLPTCRTLTATASSGKTTASNVHSSSHCSAACNSSESPSSLSVIDLTATEDDIGDEDQDFDSLFADVDMAQFEESCLASQPNDHSMTNTVLSQGSKLQSPSNRRGLNFPVSNMQSGFRVEMYGGCGGGGVGSGHVVMQTDPPSRSGKEKASINHRVEEKKSSLSSCPVCAMAFQPRYYVKDVCTCMHCVHRAFVNFSLVGIGVCGSVILNRK